MARKSFVLLVMGTVTLLLGSASSADVPDMINYQGKLTTPAGGCLNDTVQMTFSIYPDTTGSPAEWTETQNSVIVKEGIFNVLLGSVNPIPDTVFDGSVKYLGVQVESDPEMTPLKPMVTTSYAFRSHRSEEADTAEYARAAPAMPDDDWVINGDTIYHELGNVGIGTAQPDAKLNIQGGTDVGLGGGGYIVTGDLAGLNIGIDDNEIMARDSGGTSPLYIQHQGGNTILNNGGGNVGIGTTSPSGKLHVQSSDLYAGNFESDYLSYATLVIRARYTGSGSYDAIAVSGESTPADYYGIGGYFKGGYAGVVGGVYPTGSENYRGVYGLAIGGSGMNYGVYGYAKDGATNYGGYFYGNVVVTGTLSKGGGGFMIDHPLDPENKYLYHSFVESPDMMNVYNGNVILDANGEATVQLPDYFETVNGDFRYQLTCIGGFAPVFIAEEIAVNSFRIAGGEPGMKVSWQVTGIRKDPFAEANRIQVEVDKPAEERGKYLHPEAYGLGEEYGIHYEMHKRMEEEQQGSSK